MPTSQGLTRELVVLDTYTVLAADLDNKLKVIQGAGGSGRVTVTVPPNLHASPNVCYPLALLMQTLQDVVLSPGVGMTFNVWGVGPVTGPVTFPGANLANMGRMVVIEVRPDYSDILAKP